MAIVRKITPSADDNAFKAQGQKQGTMQETPFNAQVQEQRTKQENPLQRPTQTEQRNVVSEQGVQGAGVAEVAEVAGGAGGAEKQKKEKRSRYDFASIKANTYVPNINQAFTRLFLQGKWRNFRTLTNFCQGFTRTVCMDVNNPVLCSKIEEDKQGVVLNFLYYFTGLYKGNKLMPSLNITLPVRVPFPLPNCFRNLQITLHGSSAVELYTVPVSDIVIGTGYSDSVYVYNNMRKAVCKAVGVKTEAVTNRNMLRNIAHIRGKYSRTMEIAMDLLDFLYEERCNGGLSNLFKTHYMSFSATNTSIFGRKIAENDTDVHKEIMSLGSLLLNTKFQSLYMPDLYKKTGEVLPEAVSLIKGQGEADTEGVLPSLSASDMYIYKLLFACMNTCHVFINLEEDVDVVDKQVGQLMNFIKVIIMSYYCVPLKLTGVQPAVTVEMANRAKGIYNYKRSKNIIHDEYGDFNADIGGVVTEDTKVSFPRFTNVLKRRITQFTGIKEDDEFKSRAETLESILDVFRGNFIHTHSDFEDIAKRVYIKVLNCMHLGSDYDARKLPISDSNLRYLFEEIASSLPFMKREKVPTDYGKNCEFYIDRQFKIIFYTMVGTLYLYLIKYALKNNAVGGGFLSDKFRYLFDIDEDLYTCPIITTVCNECGADWLGVKMSKPFGLLEKCCTVSEDLGTNTKTAFETTATAKALVKILTEVEDI